MDLASSSRLFIFRMIALLQQCSVFLFGIPPAGWLRRRSSKACKLLMCSAMPYVNGKCYLPRIIQKHRSAMHQQCDSLIRPVSFDYALLICLFVWLLHMHRHEHKNVPSLSRRLSVSTVTVVVITITDHHDYYSYIFLLSLCNLVFDWVILLVIVSLDSGSGDWQKKALHLPRPALALWRIRTGADKIWVQKVGHSKGYTRNYRYTMVYP